jgi:hypothetical protein
MEQLEAVDQAARKRLELAVVKEKRAIVMFILNSAINFVLRTPDILIFFQESAIFSPFASFLSSYSYLSFLAIDISYLTYILAFSRNVVIYYFFNDRFQKAFLLWFEKTN